MNDIFDKNIRCIEKKNPVLADKIRNANSLSFDLQLVLNENKEYNLMIDGVLVHSFSGAQEEADRIVNSLSHNSDESVHVTFGLGLGYLFQSLCERTSGKIILYEDNFELLHTVFKLVDFSLFLGKPEISVVSSLFELKNAYFTFFTPKTQLSLTFLDYYKQKYPQKIEEIIKELKIAHETALGTYSYNIKNSAVLAESVINNLYKKISSPDIFCLREKFKNMPAIIISAGASLYENLEIIKEYQNKAVIFCVGNVYKALRENGITPDFLCIVEHRNVFYQLKDVPTKDVNFIPETTAYSPLFDFDFNNIFIYPSSENHANSWYRTLTGKKENETAETKGTVSYTALYSAKIMGCNPLILIGQDLAYVNDCCYSKNSIYSSLKCRKNSENRWEVYCDNEEEIISKISGEENPDKNAALASIQNRINMMNKNLVIAKNQNGEDVRTDVSFTHFAQYFSDFAKRFSEQTVLINSSQGGLNIEGFQNIPFEKAVRDYCKEEIDVSDIIENALKDTNINYEEIEQMLNKDIFSLNGTLLEIRNSETYIQSLRKQIQNRHGDSGVNNALKNCLDLYENISNENNSKIFLNYMYTKNAEIDNLLDNLAQNFSQDLILRVSKLLIEYFDTAQQTAERFLHKLEETKGKIHESSYTAC